MAAILNRPPNPVTSPQPIITATTKTTSEINSNIIFKNWNITFGRARPTISIATNPPRLNAVGPIKPVIHNIQNRAASSGQGNALFKPYLKNTCINIANTIATIATVPTTRPNQSTELFISAKGCRMAKIAFIRG